MQFTTVLRGNHGGNEEPFMALDSDEEKEIARLNRAIDSWKDEERDWIIERDGLLAQVEELRQQRDKAIDDLKAIVERIGKE